MRRRCKTPGCPNLHNNLSGYCDECERKHRTNEYARSIAVAGTRLEHGARASAVERGYDHKWHVFAKAFLAQHPTCAICGKRADVVDHKDIPASVMLDMWGRFDYDPDHYQALCQSCNRKKARHDAEVEAEYRNGRDYITEGEGRKNVTLAVTDAGPLFPHTSQIFEGGNHEKESE